MKAKENKSITVETIVEIPVEKTWEVWTEPRHITNWNFASQDWQCPSASNEVREEGKFNWRMEAKDGGMGFNYSGTYNQVIPEKSLALTLDDGRRVFIEFAGDGNSTKVTETFEAEDLNSMDLQRNGWQAILNNFKKYAESL